MMWAQGPVPDEGATVRSRNQHPRGICALVSVDAERGLPHAGHMEEACRLAGKVAVAVAGNGLSFFVHPLPCCSLQRPAGVHGHRVEG